MNLLEVAQATRADIAELRQEMRVRFAEMDAKFPVLKAELEGSLKTAIERGLKEQTRYFFLAWAVQLAAIVGLYAR